MDKSNKKYLKYIREIILSINNNKVDRDVIEKTPGRVLELFGYLTSGYESDIKQNVSIWEADQTTSSNMTIVRDIEYYSLCEHHLLPFFGRAHVALMPNTKLIGLSDIPKIVDHYAKRLQIQERLTSQIAAELNSLLDPKGVAVVVDGFHLCMAMRGVKKQEANFRTWSALGDLSSDSPNFQNILMSLNRDNPLN